MKGDADTLWPTRPDLPMRKYTICSVLDEIHRRVEAGNTEGVLQLLNEAHDMAKRMDRRLREYAKAAGSPSWVERGFWAQSSPWTERGARLQAVGPAGATTDPCHRPE